MTDTRETESTASDQRSATVGLTFIEMMFAVAVGDAASQIGKVMHVVRLRTDWAADLWECAPSLAHLFLVILVIACSWVGWSNSSTTRRYMSTLTAVFTVSFLMLLLDIFLVACYFILSEGAEIPSEPGADGKIVCNASAQSETLWLAIIMVTYVIWNGVTLFLKDESVVEVHRYRLVRVAQGLYVAVLTVGIWYFRKDVTSHANVLLTDFQLVAAVLLFRVPLGIVDRRTKMAFRAKDVLWATILVLCAVVPFWWHP